MAKFGRIMISGSFGERVPIKPMARGFYAHVYLHHGIGSVSLTAEKENDGDILLFEGKPVGADGAVGPLPLSVGKNTFHFTLRGADGETLQAEINLLRAYPTPCWEQLAEHAPWRPRDSAGEIVFRDRLWILGGYVPETVSDAWSRADGVNWARHADCPSARGIDIPVVYIWNDKLDVIDLTDTIWATADGESWEKVCSGAPWAGEPECGPYVNSKKALGPTVGSHRVLGGVFRDKVWLFGAGRRRASGPPRTAAGPG